jgi:TPR repeat protein
MSCTNLGAMLQRGYGVPADEARTIKLYTKACDGSELTGCNNLGLMLHRGNGVTVNKAKALEL